MVGSENCFVKALYFNVLEQITNKYPDYTKGWSTENCLQLINIAVYRVSRRTLLLCHDVHQASGLASAKGLLPR